MKYSESIFRKVVDQLYSNAISAVFATLLTVILMAIFFKDCIRLELVLIWCGINMLAMFGRVVLFIFYRRATKLQNADIKKYFIKYNFIVSISGITLGSCVYFLFTPQSPEYIAFTYFVLGGLIIGASASLAISSLTFSLYAVPVYIPFTIACYIYNLKMGIMGTVLFLFISYINSKLRNVFIQNLVFVEEKENLMEQLSIEKNKLNKLSQTDELTGLYNRRGFLFFAQQSLNLALQLEKKGHFIFADLDDLKSINDTFGHKEGDLAIKTTADVLKRTFRNMDLIGRIGGDEFTIMTFDTDDSFLQVLEMRLNKYLEDANRVLMRNYKISLSIGTVSFSNQNAASVDELISQSDKLLYQQKQNKKLH